MLVRFKHLGEMVYALINVDSGAGMGFFSQPWGWRIR